MVSPKGVYEIVDASTNIGKQNVGSWVTFPFGIKIDETLKMLYPIDRNEGDVVGTWFTGCEVEKITIEKFEFKVETKNTIYTFEKVI